MSTLRRVLGIIAGVVFILSSGAHSFMGWPALRQQLADVGASAELQAGLQAGWQFGGAAMLAFGVIVLTTFLSRSEPRPSRAPSSVIAVAYVLFGLWALVSTGNPFFLIFIIPGSLLAFASMPTTR
jgi:drug/metabolite transporter (DMT)-like permease